MNNEAHKQHKQHKLAKLLVQHVLENEEVLKGEFNLFDSGFYKGIYDTTDGKVIHNFGGEVFVKFVKKEVVMIYSDFPNEEDCFKFFDFGNLRYEGFPRVLVDGTELVWAVYVEELDRNIRLACYRGDKTVTIVFKGGVEDFKELMLRRH